MSGISRLNNKIFDELGLNAWGQRDVIHNDFNSETVETNQEFGVGSIDSSKIRNLSVETITVSNTGYIRSGKDSFTDSANAGWFFNNEGIYIGSASDASYLKYDVSAATLKIKGDITGSNITGSTITGGVLQTSTSGDRVVISGNDAFFYDATTGGGGNITGNVASIYFPRTDGNNGTFVIQKRKSTITNNGNVMEMFFENRHSTADNYLFIGREGNSSTGNVDIMSMLVNSRFEITTKSSNSLSRGPEIQMFTAKAPGSSGVQDDGTSILTLNAIDGYNKQTAFNGGSHVSIGVSTVNGVDTSILVDNSGLYTSGMSPFNAKDPNYPYNYLFADTFNIGKSDLRFLNTYSKYFHGDNVKFYSNGSNIGSINDSSGYFNIESIGSRNIRLKTGSGTTYIEGASIAPSGSVSCGLSSAYWSNVYTNNVTIGGSSYYLNTSGSVLQCNGYTKIKIAGYSFKEVGFTFKDGGGNNKYMVVLADGDPRNP